MDKIALLLTGHIRSFKNNFEYLKYFILDKFDVDVYACSWNIQEDGSIIDKSILDGYNIKNFKIVNVEDFNGNFSFVDRENDIFNINDRAKQHGKYWVDRLMRQWYIVNKGFDLISEEYDFVIRSRFDLKFSELNILNINEYDLVVPYNKHYECGISDTFAYGRYQQMKQYCNLYEHINNMYIDYNVDVSFAEEMLSFYLTKLNNFKLYIDKNIEYLIVK